MSKKLKKRLLALLLTLALCTALMLPGFAATNATKATHESYCDQVVQHRYTVDRGYDNSEHSYARHFHKYDKYFSCDCGATEVWEHYNVPESHSVPCDKCNFRG